MVILNESVFVNYAEPDAANALSNIYNWAMTRSSSPSSVTILRPLDSYSLIECASLMTKRACYVRRPVHDTVSDIVQNRAAEPFILPYCSIYCTCRAKSGMEEWVASPWA